MGLSLPAHKNKYIMHVRFGPVVEKFHKFSSVPWFTKFTESIWSLKPLSVYLNLSRRYSCSGLWDCVESGVWPIPRRAVQRPLPGTWTATLPSTEPGESAAPSPTVHPLLPKPAEGENQRKRIHTESILTVVASTHVQSRLVKSSCYIKWGIHKLSAFSLCLVSVVVGVGQPSISGWLCGSAALSGYSWNCSGASPHSAGPALSLCHTRLATQVHRHTYRSTAV